MLPKLPNDHPLRRLFDGLVEQVFMVEVGICNPRLTHYLGDLLADFVHVDHIFRLREVSGQTICELSRMEADAWLGPQVAGTQRAALVNRYIGDFTLFWAGVYPETLRERVAGADRLHEFVLQGKRSYGIAGELIGSDSDPPGSLLRELSHEFESCVHGLSLVRRGWDARTN